MKNTLFETQDGSHSLMSEQYGVSYHSRYGAIQETQHVFINAALRFKATMQKKIRILDIGFGTGLNAYATYLEADKRNLSIRYSAAEAYPISQQQAAALNYPQIMGETDTTAIFLKLHESPWGKKVRLTPDFYITKHLTRFEDLNFTNKFDIIYFDAFAPNAQPELWEEPLMSSMFSALRKEGVLVTYCAKGVVKRTMKAVGFTVEALKGPLGKREMTRAIKT